MMASVVSPRLARVLRLTSSQRFGGKRKRLIMELPVGEKRIKRLIMDVPVGGKKIKRMFKELPVGGKRKRELPVGGESKRLKRELPLGVKRTSDQQPVGEKRKRLMRDLPEELIIDEILTRLPIKSVGRFKLVSKSWKSLLSGSCFIKEHSIRSPMQNPNDYDCFVVDKYAHITIVSRYEETFVHYREFSSLIGSVNGLVCILLEDERVSLLNPAIRQCMEFNLPQAKHPTPLISLKFLAKVPTLIGVGFDHVSNDCKVVVCYLLLESCAVYSSNSNSWIQLSFPDHEFLLNKFKKSSYIPSTYVKDCPYWTYSTDSSNRESNSSFGTYWSEKNNFIKSLAALKFDATSMKFKLLPEFLPDAQSRECGKIFKYVNMRDLLTLLAYEASPTGQLDVYSLDEEKGCGVWIKMHRVGPFKEFRRFRDLQQGFKYGDEIVFHYFGKIQYCDHKTETVKDLPGLKADILINCFTYTPSMVTLKGMKSINSDNQTRPLVPILH